VVLINANTEGSGEILAAALQALDAPLVGRRTAGHAPHMRLIHDGDLHLWIPVAYWQRADGSPIHDAGVEPGEELETTLADEEGDPALDRAVELAREHGHEAASAASPEADGQVAA
jgi:C-terminal processing protease CtpA/Prc